MRAEAGNDPDHGDIKKHRDDAGDNAGDEQVADAFFGQDAVDDQRRRGRNEDAHGAAGGDRAGGETFVVVVAAHGRDGDFSHGCRGGDGRARNGGKAAAGRYCRHGDAAALIAQPSLGGIIDVFGQCGTKHKDAHQYKQRQSDEIGVEGEVKDLLADGFQRRAEAAHDGNADKAHQHHGIAQRKAEKGDGQKYGETDQRDCHALFPVWPVPGSEALGSLKVIRQAT